VISQNDHISDITLISRKICDKSIYGRYSKLMKRYYSADDKVVANTRLQYVDHSSSILRK
jgi:hypothetical protein